MITNRDCFFNKKSDFVNRLTELSPNSVVYIADTQQIWTQNKYFECAMTSDKVEELIEAHGYLTSDDIPNLTGGATASTGQFVNKVTGDGHKLVVGLGNFSGVTVGKANQLATARTIALSGDVSGSASFNGASNITINTIVADNSHNHTLSNISDLNITWAGLLDSAPSAYVTRWPSINEVTGKQNLVIKLNGGTTEGTNMFTFNGVTSKSVNITPGTIGAQVAGNYMTTDTAQSITGAKTSVGNPWAVRMSKDTSNAVAGLMWKNTSGTGIAGLTYYNTAKRIFINANIPEVTDIWSDAVGKYSLRIGWNELTYNNYPILRSDNIGSYALTPSNYTSTLDSRYVKKTGDTITGDLKLSGSNIFMPESSSNTAFTGILDATGAKAILAYFEDDTYCGLNTGTHYIRSGNTHLIHRKGSSDYTIFDSSNYTAWVYSKSQIDSNLKNYLPLAGGTMTGDIIMGTGPCIWGANELNGSMLYFDGSRTIIGSCGTSSTEATHIRSKTGHVTVGTSTTASYTILDTGNYTSHLDSRYVNISGDTMTGALTLGDSSKLNLIVGGTTRTAVYDDGDYTIFGDANYKACIRGNRIIFQNATGSSGLVMEGDTFTFKGNSIWHSGNDGSGSGLDADLLDGQHASYWQRRSTGFKFTKNYDLNIERTDASIRYNYQDIDAWVNAPDNMSYGVVLPIVAATETELGAELAFDITHNSAAGTGNMWFRGRNNLGWCTNWKKVVTDEDIDSYNAGSATKLQTARTINGTSFNGTANITTANWGTARNIGIVNSDGTGTAVTTSVNGSANVNLKLPATIKASLTGNASTASKLQTARNIILSGDVTGSASFDGSENITINTTVGNASHTHTLANISDLQASWDAILKVTPTAQVTRWPSISEVEDKQNLTIRLNGGTTEGTNQFTYNGTTTKTLSITPGSIGAAASSHSHSNYVTTNTIQEISGLKTFARDAALVLYVENTAATSTSKYSAIVFQRAGSNIGIIAAGVDTNYLYRANPAFSTVYTILDTGNYTSYTVTKTGGGASGTWGINISGNAASASSVAWANVTDKPSTFTPSSHTHTISSITDLNSTWDKYLTSGGLYERNLVMNGTTYPVFTDVSGASTMTWYAPTTAGTSGYILQSTGGAPKWISRATLQHELFTAGAGCTAIPANADLNDYQTPGNYYCAANATVATMSNTPSGYAFNLEVRTAAGVIQIFREYGYSSNRKDFIRGYYQGTWTAWKELAVTSDIPSLSGYATQSWVNSQSFAKTSDIPSLDGYATQSWVSSNFQVPLTLNSTSAALDITKVGDDTYQFSMTSDGLGNLISVTGTSTSANNLRLNINGKILTINDLYATRIGNYAVSIVDSLPTTLIANTIYFVY